MGKGQRSEGARWSTWLWGKRRWGKWTESSKETLAFSFYQILLFSSPGNPACRLVPGSRTGSQAWIITVMFFPQPLFLAPAAWEQADRSRVAPCQYRLQKSISSQTGSEIGGGSYGFLWLFLLSFLELVWFGLVRYYFELGWDKHIPLVYQMLSAASQFPQAPGLASLWGGVSRKEAGMKGLETGMGEMTVLLL